MNREAEMRGYLGTMEGTTYASLGTIDALLTYGFEVKAFLAASGEAMADAKEQLHIARRDAYLKVEGSLIAQDRKWNVSLMKDYVNDCCAKHNAYFLLCERTNRTAVHTLDLVRTAISALKEEMKNFPEDVRERQLQNTRPDPRLAHGEPTGYTYSEAEAADHYTGPRSDSDFEPDNYNPIWDQEPF